MRHIFIGLFIIAFLAGVTAKVMNDSKDRTSVVGHLLNAVGFKEKEKRQREQMNQIVHQGTASSSRVLMGSLSELIRDRLDRDTNLDLLKLKDLMRRFEDKNALLIERGKEISDFNEKQLKINEKMAEETLRAGIISDAQRMRFLDTIQSSIQQQKDLIDQQRLAAQGLQDNTQQILDKVQQMKSKVDYQEDPQFLEKLQNLSNKSKSVLDKTQEQKQKLVSINQKNSETLSAMKDKIESMQQKTRDAIDRTRQSIPDQSKSLNEDVRDRLNRMQEQRIR